MIVIVLLILTILMTVIATIASLAALRVVGQLVTAMQGTGLAPMTRE